MYVIRCELRSPQSRPCFWMTPTLKAARSVFNRSLVRRWTPRQTRGCGSSLSMSDAGGWLAGWKSCALILCLVSFRLNVATPMLVNRLPFTQCVRIGRYAQLVHRRRKVWLLALRPTTSLHVSA
jgi:hypothetical protein